jgi:hypothetical protein
VCSGVGVSETILYVSEPQGADATRLVSIVDEFVRQRDNNSFDDPSADLPCIIVTTIHRGDVVRRKLAFQDPDLAVRFLTFWRKAEPQFSAFVSAPVLSRRRV